jgi:uncharacterized coiled-coil protein SlyX
MPCFKRFRFWRRRDNGRDLRIQIAELEKKLQEREVTIAGLEQVLDRRNSESEKVEATLRDKIIYLEGELTGGHSPWQYKGIGKI